jgi:hypothetical protein
MEIRSSTFDAGHSEMEINFGCLASIFLSASRITIRPILLNNHNIHGRFDLPASCLTQWLFASVADLGRSVTVFQKPKLTGASCRLDGSSNLVTRRWIVPVTGLTMVRTSALDFDVPNLT